MQTQAKALAKRPHVVVATPGRLRVSATIALLCSCFFQKQRVYVAAGLFHNTFSSDWWKILRCVKTIGNMLCVKHLQLAKKFAACRTC